MQNRKSLLKKIINKTGNIIGTISSISNKTRGEKSDKLRNLISLARKYDNAPNFINNEPTDAYKIRFLADEGKKDYMRKVVKQFKKLK